MALALRSPSAVEGIAGLLGLGIGGLASVTSYLVGCPARDTDCDTDPASAHLELPTAHEHLSPGDGALDWCGYGVIIGLSLPPLADVVRIARLAWLRFVGGLELFLRVRTRA